MKRFYPLILTILLPFYPLAQTDISGIINTYHKVTQVIPASAGLRLDNTSGLSPGDAVVIIEMKGATVSTVNGSGFGSVTSLNNAGNYELAIICSVQDDMVYLSHQLVRSYT